MSRALSVRVDPDPWAVLVGPDGGRPFMRWDRAMLGVGSVERVAVRRFIAWDFFRERGRRMTPLSGEGTMPARDAPIVLTDARGQSVVEMGFEMADPRHLVFTLTACDPSVNRLRWGWQGAADEVLLGFGERTHPIPKRAAFDNWVEEGAVGLGPLAPWLRWTGRVPIPKGPYTSYAPMALWLSSQAYVGWLDTPARVRFWRRPGRVQTEVWDSTVTGHIVLGETPSDALARALDCLGRPSCPPPWVFAPWNDSVRGEAEARRLIDLLRRERIPSSALWIEDWMGSTEDGRRFWMRPLSHRLDRTLYPRLETLADDAHARGFRLLGYFCPEVTEKTDLYREAEAGGHLVRDQDGRAVSIQILGVRHGELDLTREATREWIKRRMLEPARALGFDGWMADFGEYLPVTARLADGTDGWRSHNRYPALWQSLHREFWQAARPDGDYTYFGRSATIGSQPEIAVKWGGDSDTDFDPADGLPTAVSQLISAGIAGLPFWATDIAGYMTFGFTRPADRELFIRWCELGALVPVMRTHHGTARPRNWKFESDRETLRIYRRFARLHTALFPYLYALAREASRDGLPIARALALAYPGQAAAWAVHDQYLLGPDLLVAPVLRRGARRRRVWLPPGRWVDWWTGAWFSGPEGVEVAAPLDRIPLFLREGSWIPLFEGGLRRDAAANLRLDGIVDTLAPARGPDLTDWTAAARVVTLVGAGTPRSEKLTLFDGARLAITVSPSGSTGSGAPGVPALAPDATDHLPAAGPGRGAFLAAGEALATSLGTAPDTVRLAVLAGSPRWYVLRRMEDR